MISSTEHYWTHDKVLLTLQQVTDDVALVVRERVESGQPLQQAARDMGSFWCGHVSAAVAEGIALACQSLTESIWTRRTERVTSDGWSPIDGLDDDAYPD